MADNIDLKRDVGRRVHEFRIQNKYTQALFAESIDISVNFLSEIENGKKGMSQETLYKLCKRFHLSADYILFGIDADRPPSSQKPIDHTTLTRISQSAEALSLDELALLTEYLISLKKLKEYDLGINQ
jgi:Predicted transcriptional regulators